MQHTPQSLAEAEAEAEAEVEMFRRQAYAIRGLVYPGPKPAYIRGNTLLPVHKRPSLTKAHSMPSTKRSKGLGAGQASTCMFPSYILKVRTRANPHLSILENRRHICVPTTFVRTIG